MTTMTRTEQLRQRLARRGLCDSLVDGDYLTSIGHCDPVWAWLSLDDRINVRAANYWLWVEGHLSWEDAQIERRKYSALQRRRVYMRHGFVALQGVW